MFLQSFPQTQFSLFISFSQLPSASSQLMTFWYFNFWFLQPPTQCKISSFLYKLLFLFLWHVLHISKNFGSFLILKITLLVTLISIQTKVLSTSLPLSLPYLFFSFLPAKKIIQNSSNEGVNIISLSSTDIFPSGNSAESNSLSHSKDSVKISKPYSYTCTPEQTLQACSSYLYLPEAVMKVNSNGQIGRSSWGKTIKKL